MAINDCAISGPDPGAVPGASTGGQKTEHRYRNFLIPFSVFGFLPSGGGETGSTDV